MKLKALTPILLLIAVSVLIFSGCAELVSTKYESVEVKIVDRYYRSAFIQPMFTGKTVIMIPHPEAYKITVEYNGIEYTIDGKETYDKYNQKIGETAIATMIIETYNDGTTKCNIVSLE